MSPDIETDKTILSMSLRWQSRGYSHSVWVLQQLVTDDSGTRQWIDVPGRDYEYD